MKAAVLHALGSPPVYEDFPDPRPTHDQLLIEVVAAALENVDKAQASGRHFSSRATFPGFPAVVGGDGVGRLDGKLIVFGGCAPPHGALAEKTIVPKAYAPFFMELADGVDPALAAAMPSSMLTSLLPLKFGARLQPGETVLVQGATGFAGRLAVQIAKKLGAGRVIGSGRDEASLKALPGLGADAVIDLKGPDAAVEAAYREFAGEEGYDVILDFLWGRPTELLLKTYVPEAIHMTAKPARLVQMGESAGPSVRLTADMLRTSGLQIIGASAGVVAAEVSGLAKQVHQWIANGEVQAEVERVALSDIGAAWTRPVHGKRLVIMPDPNV
jgi:NADPH2:quinone reductase